MEQCGYEKCKWHVDYSKEPSCRKFIKPTMCPDHKPLKAQKAPVAEVPCSAVLSDLAAKWEARIADYETRIAEAAKIGNDHGQWTLSVRQGELMGALRELREAR